ncbi:MAG: 2OG-Fe(II) oxygenase, partial [Blastopirellula sp. JB062]
MTDFASQLEWNEIAESLDQHGYAVVDLLSPAECAQLIESYDEQALFRKQVVMEKHGYGRGAYRYYAYPLPPLIAMLRTSLYDELAKIANRWNEALKIEMRFPETHASFLKRCHDAGQEKPTPLLLRYAPEDFNCLH